MNRREVLTTAVLGAAAVAVPWPALAFEDRFVRWEGESLASRHAPIVGRWIADRLREDCIYFRDEICGLRMQLHNPLFRVVNGKPIFNWMTGYTKETGLAIFIENAGIPICSTGLGTSIGYEEYFGKSDIRDKERFPDYFVRQPWLSYDERKLIEEHLPKDTFGPDMRWIEDYKAKTS